MCTWIMQQALGLGPKAHWFPTFFASWLHFDITKLVTPDIQNPDIFCFQ